MPVYTPEDVLVGPIIDALADIIQQGIPSIGHIYRQMPDRAPSDNQVLMPMTAIKVLDSTNGKLKVRVTIGARHLFRRREYDQAVKEAYTYIIPWLLLLSSWPDQTLGGIAIDVNPTDVQVTKVMESGQVYVSLNVSFNVLTEINIVVS